MPPLEEAILGAISQIDGRHLPCLAAACLALLFASMLDTVAFAAEAPTLGLTAGPHAVGFRLLEQTDPSRSVSGIDGAVHPRPIRVYLWYPARHGSDDAPEPMTFGAYAALADEDVWPPSIAGSLRQTLRFQQRPLARSLSAGDYSTLLERPMRAVDAALPAAGTYPLVALAQGLYYESPIAFAAFAEYLAGHGFALVTTPLTGTASPIVRMTVPDLETQVRDLEFAIAQARLRPFVRGDRLGLFGFDMGGMAALILALRHPDVQALVTASSGILYPDAGSLPWLVPGFDPGALHSHWLHIVPGSWIQEGRDSLFDLATHADRYLLLTPNIGHVDFTSYALIDGRAPMNGYWGEASSDLAHRHGQIAAAARTFLEAFAGEGANARTALGEDPERALAIDGLTLDHRAGEPAGPTYEQLVHATIRGEAQTMVEPLTALAARQPGHALIREDTLERLVWSLRDTWALHREVMPLVRLRVGLYPESVGARQMLADGLANIGELSQAIEIYQALVKQDPDNRWLQYRLRQLQDDGD